jgi:hypothetical protein
VALRLRKSETIWLIIIFVSPVTVPEGGVEKGQEFEVPYPSDAIGASKGKFKVRTGTRWCINRNNVYFRFGLLQISH